MISKILDIDSNMIPVQKVENEKGGINVCQALLDIKQEGIDEGISQGIDQGISQGATLKLIDLVCRKLQKGKSPEEIADALEEEISNIQQICAIAKKCNNNPESIYEHLKQNS